jgi:hypothetical protein
MDEVASGRIGDGERQATVEALTAHREGGRLTPMEYEERQVAAARARTWADVAPLFADLPQPHPVGMPVGLPSVTTGPAAPGLFGTPPSNTPDTTVGQASGLLGTVVPPRYRDTIMALTPFAAVALFFITGSWLWFFAIPVMGILLYGPEGNKQRKRDRHR